MISSIDNVLVRAAASSIASGRPSSDRHNSCTASSASLDSALRALRIGSTTEQLDGVGKGERCEFEHDLTVDVEWDLAGAQDPHPGGGVEQANGEIGGCVDDVFAVVEDDQCGAALEALEQRRLAAHVQRGDQRVDHLVWRRRGFESGQPDATGRDTVRRAQPAADRDRHRRLADAARPDDLDRAARRRADRRSPPLRSRDPRGLPRSTAGFRPACPARGLGPWKRGRRVPGRGPGSGARVAAVDVQGRGRARRPTGSWLAGTSPAHRPGGRRGTRRPSAAPTGPRAADAR